MLVAFIEASVFASDRTGVRIDLPAALTAETEVATVVEVAIDRRGDLWLGSRRLAIEELESEIETRKRASPSLTLFVRADAAAPVGRLVAVIDAARATGIEAVTVAATESGEP